MSKKIIYFLRKYWLITFLLTTLTLIIVDTQTLFLHHKTLIHILEIIISVTSICIILLFLLHLIVSILRHKKNELYIKLKTRFMPIIYQDHILENVQESIIAVALNKNNDIVYMNEQAKKIYGNLKKGDLEVLQTKLSLSEEELKEIKKQITSGQKWQGQKWLNTETKKRLLLHKISPLYSSSHLEGFLIVSSDITEFIEKHTEAETANISKSLFLANMSHEIRTPLIGVLGAAELLAKTDLDVRQQEHLSIIRRCGEEVLNIITEILDVAKIEIGLLQLNNKPCNLYNLFENIISIVKPLTAEKGLKLEFNLNFSSCTDALVDQLKLRQVLSHILFNAVKFTHKGKISIHAETKIRDNYKIFLYVAVSDTGIGIPENELKDIFNPFTQVDNSSTRNYGGTGLGLYICHKLIEIMGGNVDIQSSIGHGTTVSFTIPLTPANTRTSITSFEGLKTDNIMETDNQIEFFPPTVLLVEDNNLNQKIVAEILLNYGFEVVTASNGLECLNLLQKEDFDIILMDMQMPLMDGYEATRLIRQDEKWKNIPVIAMTAHAITGDREKCLACGCTSYIAKPFKSEDLISEIKKHLKTPVTDRKKRPVRLNLFMNELMPEFFATLGEMLEELDACIAIKDIEKVQSISHDIKGTAGMYDFNQISETAAQMEQAARRHIWEDIYILQQRLYNLYQDSKANFSEVS